MSRHAVVAMDVGGTSIDAACVSADGELIGPVLESGSPAAGTSDEIIAALTDIIGQARHLAEAGDALATACGIAIPGPFDYAAGVSCMEHKFQAIRGRALGSLLQAATGLPTYFVNDADAFGLGVSWRQLPDTKRFVALTIGTGLGGSFIEDGANIRDDSRVPPGGEVWHLPVSGGILEDHVSARAVTAAYERATGGAESALEVANRARHGEPHALAAYHALGTALGHGLAPVLARFAPETMVIGGKVGQSLALFRPALEQALAAAGIPELPVIPAAAGNLAIWGAARYPAVLGAVR